MNGDEFWFGADGFVAQPTHARDGDIVTFCANSDAAAQSMRVAAVGRGLARALPDGVPPVLMIDLASATSPGDGAFELFEALRLAVDARLEGDDATGAPGRPVDDDVCDALVDVVDFERYVEIRECGLRSMPAGRASPASFAWRSLFDKAPGLFRALCHRLMREFSVVLIDAPGARHPAFPICVALMPNALVVGTSDDGTDVATALRRAIGYRYGSSDLRPLRIYPPTRLDANDASDSDWRLDLVALDAAITADAPVAVGAFEAGMRAYHAEATSPERLLPWLATRAAPWESPLDVLSQQQADALLRQAGDDRAFADISTWRRWFAGISERAGEFEQPSIARPSAIAAASRLALDLVRTTIRTLAGDIESATALLVASRAPVEDCGLTTTQLDNLLWLATAWLDDHTPDELRSSVAGAWFDAAGALIDAATLYASQKQRWHALRLRYDEVVERSPVSETDVVRTMPGVRAMILRMTRDVNLANDLTQDVMIAVVVAIREGRLRQPEALAGYVHETARHIVYAANRKMRPVTVEMPAAESEPMWQEALTPAEYVEQEDLRRIALEVLDELPSDRDRELIRGFFVYGLSKAELTTRFGLSDSHFERVFYRARTRLRDRLHERLHAVERMVKPPENPRARITWQFADSLHAVTYNPPVGRTYAAETPHGRVLVRDDRPSYFAREDVLAKLSANDIVLPALVPTDEYPSPDELERPNFELAWFSGRPETIELAPWVDRAANYRLWRTPDLGAAESADTMEMSMLFRSRSTSVHAIMRKPRWAVDSIARFVNASSMIGDLISASAVEASHVPLSEPDASTRIDALLRSLS